MIGWLLKLITGNPLVLLWSALGIAVVTASTGFGAAWTVQGWRLEALRGEYETFKARVQALGEIAQQRANTQAAADKLRKEKADADQKNAVSLLNQRIASLRHDADSSGRYLLPTAAPGAARPDVACFDRRSFELATRNALEGLRGLADECDAAIISLNIAKAWGKSLPAD